jgi:transposase
MEWIACVGIDWGDQEHAYVLQTRTGERREGKVRSAPEELHGWVQSLRKQFPEGNIVVAVEQGRGSLIDALVGYDFFTLIPINPRASKAYRDSRRLSGASTDPADAELICEFALKHLDELRVWRADDAITRKLRTLTETRRQLVDQRTALAQQLTAVLKGYFPQALQWFSDVSARVLWSVIRLWPTLSDLQQADAEQITRLMKAHRLRRIPGRVEQLTAKLREAVSLTMDPAIIEPASMHAQALARMLEVVDEQIDRYERAIEQAWATHPDRRIFVSLPGAGPTLAPRLAVAFGSDRSRYQSAFELQCFSGIAPVTEQSGQSKWIHARWQYPKFLHQSFHEFAASSLPHSMWAKTSYQQQRKRGASHHTAIRTVAFQWIRIIFRLWKDQCPYDEAIYLQALRSKNSPLCSALAA